MAWKLFEDIGEFFTGDKAKAAEQKQDEQTQKLQEQQNAAISRADQYGNQVRSDMGTGAADYMQKANAAASGQAEQAGRVASTQAIRDQIRAARTSGVNRGQAALMGGQAAGNAYQGTYQNQLTEGRNQYGQNVAQRAGLEQANRSNALANAQLVQGGQAQAQQTAGSAAAAGGQTAGGIMQAIPGVLAALSDETQKTNIAESGGSRLDALMSKIKTPSAATPMSRLDELASKVRSVDFNYKPESGEDPTRRNVGVIAQDLEQTDMADNVVDTPQGKVIDIPKQTLSNTNYIADMARELYELKAELRELKGQN